MDENTHIQTCVDVSLNTYMCTYMYRCSFFFFLLMLLKCCGKNLKVRFVDVSFIFNKPPTTRGRGAISGSVFSA